MRRINLPAREICERLEDDELKRRPLNDEETRATLTLCVVLRLRLNESAWERIEVSATEARREIRELQFGRTS